MYYITILTAA